MKTITKLLSGFFVTGLFVVAFIQTAQAAYECPEGFYWSRETIACEQTTCPANSHRNYTLECICDNETDTGNYTEIGLLGSCSAGKPNTNSVEASNTPGNVNAIAEPEVIQPTPDDELTNVLPFVPTERQTQFRELVRRYRDTIPRGVYGYGVPEPYQHIFSPGQMNNLTYGANSTACGGYQDQVLKWLLSIYFNNNSTDKALLDGFDFGPIQITKGAHQAVVIFPKGTDWHSTGVVFDPWPEQTPRLYTLDQWDGMFLLSPAGSTGNIITPIDSNIGKFPTTPSDNGAWEYDDVYTAGSRVPRNRAQGGRRIAVRSPVAVVVTNGVKSVGVYDDGSFINDFGSNIEGYITAEADGTFRTDYNLPDDSYGIALTATGDGDVHVYAGTNDDEAIVFDTVTVSAGDQLILGWDEADTKPRLADANAEEVASEVLTDLAVPAVATDNNTNVIPTSSTATDLSSWIGLGIIIFVIVVITVILIVLVIVSIIILKRKLLNKK